MPVSLIRSQSSSCMPPQGSRNCVHTGRAWRPPETVSSPGHPGFSRHIGQRSPWGPGKIRTAPHLITPSPDQVEGIWLSRESIYAAFCARELSCPLYATAFSPLGLFSSRPGHHENSKSKYKPQRFVAFPLCWTGHHENNMGNDAP